MNNRDYHLVIRSFGNYYNCTEPIYLNTLTWFTGRNGMGKSGLLDALKTLLIGDQNYVTYNPQATKIPDIGSYIQTFNPKEKLPGPTIIALHIFDKITKTKILIGVLYSKSGTPYYFSKGNMDLSKSHEIIMRTTSQSHFREAMDDPFLSGEFKPFTTHKAFHLYLHSKGLFFYYPTNLEDEEGRTTFLKLLKSSILSLTGNRGLNLLEVKEHLFNSDHSTENFLNYVNLIDETIKDFENKFEKRKLVQNKLDTVKKLITTYEKYYKNCEIRRLYLEYKVSDIKYVTAQKELNQAIIEYENQKDTLENISNSITEQENNFDETVNKFNEIEVIKRKIQSFKDFIQKYQNPDSKKSKTYLKQKIEQYTTENNELFESIDVNKGKLKEVKKEMDKNESEINSIKNGIAKLKNQPSNEVEIENLENKIKQESKKFDELKEISKNIEEAKIKSEIQEKILKIKSILADEELIQEADIDSLKMENIKKIHNEVLQVLLGIYFQIENDKDIITTKHQDIPGSKQSNDKSKLVNSINLELINSNYNVKQIMKQLLNFEISNKIQGDKNEISYPGKIISKNIIEMDESNNKKFYKLFDGILNVIHDEQQEKEYNELYKKLNRKFKTYRRLLESTQRVIIEIEDYEEIVRSITEGLNKYDLEKSELKSEIDNIQGDLSLLNKEKLKLENKEEDLEITIKEKEQLLNSKLSLSVKLKEKEKSFENLINDNNAKISDNQANLIETEKQLKKIDEIENTHQRMLETLSPKVKLFRKSLRILYQSLLDKDTSAFPKIVKEIDTIRDKYLIEKNKQEIAIENLIADLNDVKLKINDTEAEINRLEQKVNNLCKAKDTLKSKANQLLKIKLFSEVRLIASVEEEENLILDQINGELTSHNVDEKFIYLNDQISNSRKYSKNLYQNFLKFSSELQELYHDDIPENIEWFDSDNNISLLHLSNFIPVNFASIESENKFTEQMDRLSDDLLKVSSDFSDNTIHLITIMEDELQRFKEKARNYNDYAQSIKFGTLGKITFEFEENEYLLKLINLRNDLLKTNSLDDFIDNITLQGKGKLINYITQSIFPKDSGKSPLNLLNYFEFDVVQIKDGVKTSAFSSSGGEGLGVTYLLYAMIFNVLRSGNFKSNDHQGDIFMYFDEIGKIDSRGVSSILNLSNKLKIRCLFAGVNTPQKIGDSMTIYRIENSVILNTDPQFIYEIDHKGDNN